jgi:hypothetical protein
MKANTNIFYDASLVLVINVSACSEVRYLTLGRVVGSHFIAHGAFSSRLYMYEYIEGGCWHYDPDAYPISLLTHSVLGPALYLIFTYNDYIHHGTYNNVKAILEMEKPVN